VKKKILLAAISLAVVLTSSAFAYDLEPYLRTKNRTVLMYLSPVRATGPLQDGFASFNDYADFRKRLDSNYQVAVRQEDTCLIYALREPSTDAHKSVGMDCSCRRPSIANAAVAAQAEEPSSNF